MWRDNREHSGAQHGRPSTQGKEGWQSIVIHTNRPRTARSCPMAKITQASKLLEVTTHTQPAHRRIMSVTRQPLSERTLWSSQWRSVAGAPMSRSSLTSGMARRAYSRSMEMPQNCGQGGAWGHKVSGI